MAGDSGCNNRSVLGSEAKCNSVTVDSRPTCDRAAVVGTDMERDSMRSKAQTKREAL
jgi:hypothetical protein